MKKFLGLSVFAAVFAGLLLATGCGSWGKRWDEGLTVARFLVEGQQGDLLSRVRLPVSGTMLEVESKSVITEVDIVNVDLVDGELGPLLVFQLTSDAARDFFRFTAQHQGRRLVLFVDMIPLGARLIERPVAGGVIMVYVEMEKKDAEDLAKRLKESSAKIQKQIAKQRV